MDLETQIQLVLDNLIPRGGEKPNSVYVSIEEYLSRIANFNRKLLGVKYRRQCWTETCQKHKIEFDRVVNLKNSIDVFKTEKPKITKFTYSLRDVRLENEFEMLLYSITSTLSALTRLVACFLKSSTQTHSHSKLSDTLSKYPDFNQSRILVDNANDSWAKELIERRDAATHYIALSLKSSLEHLKSDPVLIDTTISRVGITKTPVKYVSIWEDDLPIKRLSHTKIGYDNGTEINELKDSQERIIVRREKSLGNIPELIDGEIYVRDLYDNFEKYVKVLLDSLSHKI